MVSDGYLLKFFFNNESTGAIDPRGVVSLKAKGLIGRIKVEEY